MSMKFIDQTTLFHNFSKLCWSSGLSFSLFMNLCEAEMLPVQKGHYFKSQCWLEPIHQRPMQQIESHYSVHEVYLFHSESKKALQKVILYGTYTITTQNGHVQPMLKGFSAFYPLSISMQGFHSQKAPLWLHSCANLRIKVSQLPYLAYIPHPTTG